MKYGLIEYKCHTTGIQQQLKSLLEKSGLVENASSMERDVNEQLMKSKPSLMFYGVYNAGKSSIINAILGENVAEVGDVPTTQEIHTFQWHEFTITDTPGINANNQHTLTAEDAIIKNDVIVFVIDNMNVDSAEFYKAIVTLLIMGKPTIVVLNEKTDADTSKLTQQILYNIQYAGESRNIRSITEYKNFCGIITVNANTAIQAALLPQDSPDFDAIYKYSNITDLIAAIQQELNCSTGVKQLRPAIDIMEKSTELLIEHLEDKMSSNAQKQYHQAMQNLQKQKDILSSSLISEGKMAIYQYADKLYGSISSNSSVNVDPSEITVKLQSIINQAFAQANLSLKAQAEFFSTNLKELNVTVDKESFSIKVPSLADLPDNSSESSLASIALGGAVTTGIGSVAKSILPITIPGIEMLPIIVAIIGGIAKLFGSKDKDNQRYAEMQNEINQRNAEMENRMNEAVSKIMECNNKIRTEIQRLENSYISAVTALAKDSYEPLFEKLNSEFTRTKNLDETIRASLSVANRILTDLANLKAVIG